MTEAAPTTPLHDFYPDDLHYTGSIESETLGRDAVLAHDLDYVDRMLRADLDPVAEQRLAEERQDKEVASFYTHPSVGYTKEERQHAGVWQDALHSALYEGRVSWRTEGPNIKPKLDDVRAKIREIDPNLYGAHFNQILDRTAPPILRKAVKEWTAARPEAEGAKWLLWLGSPEMPATKGTQIESGDINVEKLPEEDRQKVYDEQLLNFLQWHNHRAETLQQHPEFEEALEQKVDSFVTAVYKGESEGWLAPGTFLKALTTLQTGEIAYLVGDEFYAASLGWAAYANEEEAVMFVPRNLETTALKGLLKGVEKYGTHEFNHAALGSLEPRWIKEALTEHIAEVLDGKREVEDLWPQEDEIYAAERQLLWTLIDAANRFRPSQRQDEALVIRDFTLTYSKAYTSDKQEAVRGLAHKLERIFGFTMLDGISAYLMTEEQRLADSGVTNIREQQTRALESARHMLAQQAEKLKDYLPVAA